MRLRVPLPEGRGDDEGDGVTSIRVMLVEDDADFRRLMASLFGRQSDLEVFAQTGLSFRGP